MFSVPGQPAAMQMDLLHMKIEKGELSPDGKTRRVYARGGDWTMTSCLTPAQRKLDARGLRDFNWSERKKGPFTLTQIRTYEMGNVAFLEYMIDSFQGKNVHQKNAFAYLVSGDQWLDVHISKTLYDISDEKFMNSMLGSIRLMEHYEPDSRVEFGYGSSFYLKKDWERASQHYQKAFEMERRQKQRYSPRRNGGCWSTASEWPTASPINGKKPGRRSSLVSRRIPPIPCSTTTWPVAMPSWTIWIARWGI